MKVVIDGDQMIYATGFATEAEPVNHAFHLVNKAINRILENTSAHEYQIYIGGKGNFREEMAETQGYKANRPERKPKHYSAIKDFLINEKGAIPVNGMEADDMVSILLYEDYKFACGNPTEANVILSSPDKDLKNTPGWHYNPMRDTLTWITEEQANRHFLFQMLVGDTVDNIKGLPHLPQAYVKLHKLPHQATKGIGEGTAKKILQRTITFKEGLSAVLDAYMAWGISEGYTFEQIMRYVQEQAVLLWMVRELDCFGEPVIFELNEEWYERGREAFTSQGGVLTEEGGTPGGDEDTSEGVIGDTPKITVGRGPSSSSTVTERGNGDRVQPQRVRGTVSSDDSDTHGNSELDA